MLTSSVFVRNTGIAAHLVLGKICSVQLYHTVLYCSHVVALNARGNDKGGKGRIIRPHSVGVLNT